MKQFVINLLTALGLGVHGNIRSYKSLFPLYEFDIKELQSNASTTIIEVVDTLDVVFTIQLEHDDKGYITKIDTI
jgi:hypothetical protein